MWYRVFCRSGVGIAHGELLDRVQQRERPVIVRFKGDDLGWTSAEFTLGTGTPVYAERYLTNEDEIRDDLNTWAAYLETLDYSPNNVSLMERVIQSRQLVTIRKPLDHPNESAIDDLCQSICQVIAAAADGMYQVENIGWYAADGTLLLQEY